MDKQLAINNVIDSIKKVYSETSGKLRPNITRGHLRSISTDIEDAIAVFVSSLLPENYQILLDPSIHVDGVNNRPDMIVVDPDGLVKAMIEIKANMGWCRDARGVINDIVENDHKFRLQAQLDCEFSREETINVSYKNNVSLFLVSLTDGNCPEEKHIKNKEYAARSNVKHFLLFSGWYGNLVEKEIKDFASTLESL